jgi:hypothetical protein
MTRSRCPGIEVLVAVGGVGGGGGVCADAGEVKPVAVKTTATTAKTFARSFTTP